VAQHMRNRSAYSIARNLVLVSVAGIFIANLSHAQTVEPTGPTMARVTLSATAATEVPHDWMTIQLSTTRDGTDANAVQSQLKAALQAALAVAKPMAEGERLAFQRALAQLSAREREVLDELLQGHYNKNIADHLGITPRTVEFHRANIFEKLQVQSAVELAHLMGRYAPGSGA